MEPSEPVPFPEPSSGDPEPELLGRMAQAILYLAEHGDPYPSLAAVAQQVGLSLHRLRQTLRHWLNIDPECFLQYLTVDHARQALVESQRVLDAAFAAGRSAPGGRHRLRVAVAAVGPGAYRTRDPGPTIRYGTGLSPFGPALVAVTPQGICGLAFTDSPGSYRAALERLRRTWPQALFQEDPPRAQAILARIFHLQPLLDPPLHLHVRGTHFQSRVWKALLRIPPAAVISYGDLARRMGLPRQAARAVGRAVADNPVAYLVPCHRVLRNTGVVSGYRWGRARKRALLAWEAARLQEERRPGPDRPQP